MTVGDDGVLKERLRKLHAHSPKFSKIKSMKDLVVCALDAMESIFDADLSGFLVVLKNSLRSIGVRGIEVPPSSLLDYTDKGVAQALLRRKDVDIRLPTGGLPLDGPGITIRAINQNRSQLVNDIREDPEYTPSIEHDFKKSASPPRLSELATPIYVDETPFGILNLESKELNAFTQQDLELLEVLAGQLAVTLQRLKIEARMKDLHLYTQRLSRANTIRDLVESTIDTMDSIFEVTVCDFIIITDNRLRSIATRGPHLPPPEELHIDEGGISQAFFPSDPDLPPVPSDRGLNLEGAGVCVRAIRQRKPQLVNDIRLDPDYVVYHTSTLEFFKEKGIEILSELTVPIMVDGAPFGVLNLESERLNGFSQQDLELLEILASQVAISISNMRVYEATSTQLTLSQEQYGVLSDSLHVHASRLADVIDLDEITSITKQAIKQVLGFSRVGFGIVEGDGLRFLRVDRPVESDSIPLDGKGITVRAVNRGETQLVPDTEKDPDWFTLTTEGPKTRSELVVPIRIEDQIVGVLDLASENVDAFTSEHAKLVEIFSSNVASALLRARTHELENARARLLSYQGRLEALHASSARLVEAQSLSQVSAMTKGVLEQVLGHTWGGIGFVERDRFAYHDTVNLDFPEGFVIPLDSKSIIVRAIKTRETQLVHDVTVDPDYLPFPLEELQVTMLSELTAPIIVEGEAVGAINVESPNTNAFTQEDVRLLETLARHVASAMGRLESERDLRESEERFRALYENSLDGIIVRDARGMTLAINQAGATIFGYDKPEDLIGKHVSTFLAVPGQEQEVTDMLLEQGFIRDHEVKIKKKDGSMGYISADATLQLDEDGELERVETYFRDITEQKRMEEALRSNQELMESFMSNATDRFYILDEDFVVLSVNDAALEKYGFEREEIIGRNFFDVFSMLRGSGRMEQYQRVFETGESFFTVDPSDSEDQFQLRVFRIEGGIGVIATEITELMSYQGRLEALHTISTELVKANNIDQIAGMTIEALEQVLGHAWAEVGFVEGDRFVWQRSSERTFDDGKPSVSLVERSVIVRAIKTKETQKVPDVRDDPDYIILHPPEDGAARMSELAVPILVEGIAVGALNVESPNIDAFAQEDARLLETLAQHVAAAFGRLRADQVRARQFIELTYRLNNLEPGSSYFCESHDRCFKVFAELSMHGVPGICIVRDDPERLVEGYGLAKESVLLLSSRPIKGFSAINDLQEISLTFSNLLRDAVNPVILLDGVEYLITMFGFERVFNFLQEKKFDVLEADGILFLPVDLMTLNEQQKALLAGELKSLT